jgi:hypothetical protein
MDIIETRPAVKLKGLRVEEISICDIAANPQASIIITKRSSADVTKAAIYPVQPANGKLPNFGGLKPQPESEVSMSEISKADATEAVLDALVLARQQQHPDETTPVAMTKVLATEAGRKIYGEMVFAKDLEIAKATTLRTYGNRDVKKVGSSSADTRPAPPASDPWRKLDQMAKEHSSTHGMPFHQSYTAIIGTPQGQKLYAAGLAKPSAAGATV